MREGWVGDDYLILFETDEQQVASAKYSIPELLPGYRLLGLRGWDDFIVEDDAGHLFTVPTVPAITAHLNPFRLPRVDQVWMADERLRGKIKWYLKPLVFGGDPSSEQNRIWIDLDQHAQLIRYWNDVYRSARPNSQ